MTVLVKRYATNTATAVATIADIVAAMMRQHEVLMASCQDTQALLDANLINSAMPSIPIPLTDYSGTDWVYSS